MPRRTSRSLATTLLLVTACGAKTDLPAFDVDPIERLPDCLVDGETRPCESICGVGTETCFSGKWQFCDAPRPRAPELAAVVRDFRDDHPDFERPGSGLDRGIVDDVLGPDDKPVYSAGSSSLSTSGAVFFDTWYRDTPSVNVRLATNIQLVASPADPDLFVYANPQFFPIDDEGFGNQGRPHNYHFSLEVATAFRYVGGEVFSFRGDDDLWVFINRRLVIDLGGVHVSLSDRVELDRVADEIGLELGEVYPLHLFFAERHTIASNFNVETTIAEFELCD